MQGLETTGTYNAERKTFTMNSPGLTAAKWYVFIASFRSPRLFLLSLSSPVYMTTGGLEVLVDQPITVL